MLKRVGLENDATFREHSEQDWHVNNCLQFQRADGDCSKSEAIVAECNRACQETRDKTENKRTEVERKFDLRLGDVEYFRNEIDSQIAALQESIEKLIQHKDRLQTSLDSCTEPLNVCRECLAFREKRMSIDLVVDKPQHQLEKYNLLLHDTCNLLKCKIKEVEEQIRSNRAIKNHLLRDVMDKFTAIEIDTKAVGSSPGSLKPYPYNFDSALMVPSGKTVTLAEWESYCIHNIRKSEHERQCSDRLMVLVEELLHQTYYDLRLQNINLKSAFRDRINEYQTTKTRLEERLARVVEQIEDVENTILKLQQNIDHKLPILALTGRRMEERRKRPRAELCRDHVEMDLERQVAQLNETLGILKDRQMQAEEMLRMLKQTRLSLEKDIEIKSQSVYLDEVQCVPRIASVAHVTH